MIKVSDIKTAAEYADLLVQENFVREDEDTLPYLIIFGALENGANKKKVKAWIGINKDRLSDFNEMWGRAVDQHIFVKGKIAVEDPDAGLDTVELVLYAMTLAGLVERCVEE